MPVAIAFSLSQHQTAQGLAYQLLSVELTSRDRMIAPADLAELALPEGIEGSLGVVVSGRAPVWLYSYLVHELHATAWVACYDPRLGAVVVATHSAAVRVGQVLDLQSEAATDLCPALLVVGPPDSGKSVLSHALFQGLLPEQPAVYLQRANWDGEGNWVLELDPAVDTEAMKRGNKGAMTDRFFPDQAQAILALRRQKSLVIVDVGGRVQPEKLPVLEACSHYLIISAKPEEIDPWHEFCRDRGNLIPVAVIRSTLEATEQFHQQEPYLEMTCGPWLRGQSPAVPERLLQRVRSLVRSH